MIGKPRGGGFPGDKPLLRSSGFSLAECSDRKQRQRITPPSPPPLPILIQINKRDLIEENADNRSA
jgi:hypothetical protein